MKPILEIQNISKKFRINHEQQPYLSLRDSLTSIFRDKSSKEDFWALKDVSFDVMPGDTVGIIGKNGAGKSTLLKILSKITPPTSGKIIGRGRIASLLEVGTGFHPELSGRENIFMNGSILGMKHAEIQRNFDAIVDFAGVEKFLDTPLKHYSSGMQLRLAFAVAAFLENEILIIDEVLAVGDAEFQKKCIGKMEDVSKSGRTVLFVSHNMYALNQLCVRSVVLRNGSVVSTGNTAEMIAFYNAMDDKNTEFKDQSFAIGDSMSLKFTSSNFDAKVNEIEMEIKFEQTTIISSLALFINNIEGFRIGVIDCRDLSFPVKGNVNEVLRTRINFSKLPFVEGDYYVGMYIESTLFKGNIDRLIKFSANSKEVNTNAIVEFPKQYRGVLELQYEVLNNKIGYGN